MKITFNGYIKPFFQKETIAKVPVKPVLPELIKDEICFTSNPDKKKAIDIINGNPELSQHYNNLSEFEKRRFLNNAARLLGQCREEYYSEDGIGPEIAQLDLTNPGYRKQKFYGATLNELIKGDMNSQQPVTDSQVDTYLKSQSPYYCHGLIKEHIVDDSVAKELLKDIE